MRDPGHGRTDSESSRSRPRGAPPSDGAVAAVDLDRHLRALSGRAARCRLLQGWLAGDLLARRGWFALGFARLGDYAVERLGIGARLLEEEARIAVCLSQLPRITTAFLDGSVTWTALRLIAGVATAGDEQRWLEQAARLDARRLADLVREAATSRPTAPDPPAPPGNESPDDESPGDEPKHRWTIRVSRSGRRLWRAACEMAQRSAGSRLTPAQVLELLAAEAAGSAEAGHASEDASGRAFEHAPDQAMADASEGPPPTRRSGAPETAPAPRLTDLLAAEIERTASAPQTRRLAFLTMDSARDLEERDPQLAAFYAEQLADDGPGHPSDAPVGPDAPPPPEDGWFEATLRRIGEAEGFPWLAKLGRARPSDPVEWLEAEFDAIEAADPHTIDARLREVRRGAQALDFELAGLLREAADRRLHRDFHLANLEEYVETRLGFCARTAWSLLSLERAIRRSCPQLGEAWRSGRVSTLAARILLPVVAGAHAEEWIARAAVVTLRRLEAEVNWALDRRDASRAEAGDAHDSSDAADSNASASPNTASAADAADAAANAAKATDAAMLAGPTDSLSPPPLDHDVGATVLSAVTIDGLQMRARPHRHTSGAGGLPRSVTIAFFAPGSVIRLAEETMQRLRCGSESRGRAFERMIALAMLEWMSAPKHRDPVFERDGWRCAVPGCRSRRNLHDHHVTFRSHGGDNAPDNRITVCAAHHLHGLHRGRIEARGRAPHGIEWKLGCRWGGNPPLARLLGDRYLDGGGA